MFLAICHKGQYIWAIPDHNGRSGFKAGAVCEPCPFIKKSAFDACSGGLVMKQKD